jgi:hypothetical protein
MHGGDFIDMHAVCVRELMAPVGGRHGICDVDRQLALYDRICVVKGVIMPVANAECTPTGQANEEVLRIVAAHPDRFAAFCNLDPRNCYNSPTTKFGEVLDQYKAQGCRGVGAVCAKLAITDLRVQKVVELIKNNAVVDNDMAEEAKEEAPAEEAKADEEAKDAE